MKAIFTTTGEVKISDDIKILKNVVQVMVKFCDVDPASIVVEGCTRKEVGLK